MLFFPMSGDVYIRRGKSHWILSIGRLLIFYVISWGPVAGIYATGKTGSRPPAWVVTLYRPLDWLRTETKLNKPIVAYLDWWRDFLKSEEQKISPSGSTVLHPESAHLLDAPPPSR